METFLKWFLDEISAYALDFCGETHYQCDTGNMFHLPKKSSQKPTFGNRLYIYDIFWNTCVRL